MTAPLTMSPRECEVAILIALGLYDREIAARLGTSQRTVQAQVRSILGRTGARRRCEITAWVWRQLPELAECELA